MHDVLVCSGVNLFDNLLVDLRGVLAFIVDEGLESVTIVGS